MRTYARAVSLTCSPFEVAAAFCNKDYFAFLDSSRADTPQGRYSILGWEPAVVLRSKGHDVYVRIDGEWRHSVEHQLDALGRLLRGWNPERQSTDNVKFGGGAIGYLGYDLFPFIERYENLKAEDDLQLPDCCLGLYEMLLVFDHQSKEWSLVGNSALREDTNREELFKKRLAQIERGLAEPPSLDRAPAPRAPVKSGLPQSNMTKEQYIAAVQKALDYIYAGDVYQVNLSQRFCCQLDASPFDLFSSLRKSNPSFYGAYLNCEDHVIISSSPELFLSREGPVIETRPIKGTRPRGRTEAEDKGLENALLTSGKDAAELAMIVDLERNDLGRVCEYGTVEVAQHRYIEQLPTLFHTISTVRGRIRPQTDAMEILRATFPGGSITGCPKIRAIEIIDELEPTRRHVYTGAIGFIGLDGSMTLNIAIRTLVAVGNRVYYQVGGGIVADSVPEDEYAETLDKAHALRRAIASVGSAEASADCPRAGRADTTSDFLKSKALLDPSISPHNERKNTLHTALLTGATGFLGPNLLGDLLKHTSLDVLCLIRASDVSEGEKRIREKLQEQGLWQDDFGSRLRVVLGDLSQARFGLSEAEFACLAEVVDVIYHNGAWVNMVYPYSVLAATNVGGTVEVLRLACLGPPSAVHFVSSLAVFSSSAYADISAIEECFETPNAEGLRAPYPQTKWVSERLVGLAAERGLPSWIYRLGVITSHSRTGFSNLNDRLSRLLCACVRLRSAPELDGIVFFTPVDYISRAIVSLSTDPCGTHQAFHLINQESLSWTEVVDTIRAAGYDLDILPYERWLEEIRKLGRESGDTKLQSLAGILRGGRPFQRNKSRRFDCRNAVEGLRQKGVRGCPEDSQALLMRCLSFLASKGAFL